MLTLGVDPALAGPCGLALVADAPHAPRIVATGAFLPPKGDWQSRLYWVARQVAGVVSSYQAQGLALVAYEASWAGDNVQTTRKLALVGGAVVGVAASYGLPCVEVQPAEGKRALAGVASADKAAMMAAAHQQFGLLLSEHEADAIGIALHAAAVTHRAALVAAALP